jgi:hypothetical protein
VFLRSADPGWFRDTDVVTGHRSQVVDAPAGLGVDEDGGVDEAAAQGEVVISSTRSGASALAMSTICATRVRNARWRVAEMSPRSRPQRRK